MNTHEERSGPTADSPGSTESRTPPRGGPEDSPGPLNPARTRHDNPDPDDDGSDPTDDSDQPVDDATRKGGVEPESPAHAVLFPNEPAPEAGEPG